MGGGPGTLSWQNVLLQVIHVGGTVAVDVFVFISGYYCKEHGSINWKRIINLVLEMYFYSVAIYFLLVAFETIDFSVKGCIKAFLPTVYGNWFCVYYLLLCMVEPFLVMFAEKLEKEKLAMFIFVLLFLDCVIPTFFHALMLGNFTKFITMFFIGYALKRFTIKRKAMDRGGILSFIAMIILIIAQDYLGTRFNRPQLMEIGTYFDKNESIFVVAIAVCLFLIFSNKAFYSGLINYIAKSVIGIYLIHDNENIRNLIWHKWWDNTLYYNSPVLMLHILSKTCIVFAVCLLIDIIRRSTLEKVAQHITDRLYSSISILWNRAVGRMAELVEK